MALGGFAIRNEHRHVPRNDAINLPESPWEVTHTHRYMHILYAYIYISRYIYTYYIYIYKDIYIYIDYNCLGPYNRNTGVFTVITAGWDCNIIIKIIFVGNVNIPMYCYHARY